MTTGGKGTQRPYLITAAMGPAMTDKHRYPQERKLIVGDEVTVEYDDEGKMDTLTGTVTGFHDVDGERGFWLKYNVADNFYISWWRLTAVRSG